MPTANIPVTVISSAAAPVVVSDLDKVCGAPVMVK
jgi:hypothetical protein